MDEYRPSDLESDERVSEAEPARPRRFGVVLLVALAFAVAVAAGVAYWLHARHFQSTDDAFIDGHISQVSAQISGRVIRLMVDDNQAVEAGQILIEIDPRDAQSRLNQANARRDEAAAALDQARANLPVRRADAAQAAAQVQVTEADLFQAKADLARYRAINPRAVTRQIVDNATASARSAQAKLDANRQAAEAMRAQIAAAQAQVKASEAALRTAETQVADAELQLSYTHVAAPAAGRVARRTVELGHYVAPGQALLAVVQPDVWVTANFKESQLTLMHPGQKVRVATDAFPDTVLDAHVDSLQSGTGSVFSSLPAENATGNYVKIVQRLPVKIVFDGDAWKQLRLAPGMSVTPRVTVR